MIDAKLRRILSELILLALLLVLLGVELYNSVRLNSNIITRHFLLTDSFHTPVFHIWDTRIQKKKGIAVLVHGFQCNKSMMVQLGKFLATQGVDIYAIDLPGHGESSVPFTYERCYEAAKEVTSEIIKLAGLVDKQVILVGHSFGCSVLGPVGLEHSDIAASVYIGPSEMKGLKVDAPRNVLVITGEHDNKQIRARTGEMFDSLTGRPFSRPGSEQSGDIKSGTARAWREAAGATHINLLLSDDVYGQVQEWIDQALHVERHESETFKGEPSRHIPLLMLAICLVLASLIAKVVPSSRDECGPLFPNWSRPVIIFGFGIPCGAALVIYYNPLGFLHLQEGEVLASIVFSIGLFSLLFFMLLERRRTVSRLKSTLGDALVALATFSILYSCLVFSVGREFYQLEFHFAHTARMMAFAITAICSLPFFLMTERLLRYVQGLFRGFFSGLIVSMIVAVPFYAVFVLSMSVVSPKLSRFTYELLAVVGYCSFVGGIFYHTRRSIIPGAVFTSLVIAWVISVGFIYY